MRVPGSLGWTQISAGFSHTCAVRTDGALYCWGANDRGQLGIGDEATVHDRLDEVHAADVDEFVAIPFDPSPEGRDRTRAFLRSSASP